MTNVISAVLNATFRELKQTLLEGGGGGGRRAEYKKKYSRKGKLNEKKSCTPINPKKYSSYGLKLKFMKEFHKEKNFSGTKIPPPPMTLLLVRP